MSNILKVLQLVFIFNFIGANLIYDEEYIVAFNLTILLLFGLFYIKIPNLGIVSNYKNLKMFIWFYSNLLNFSISIIQNWFNFSKSNFYANDLNFGSKKRFKLFFYFLNQLSFKFNIFFILNLKLKLILALNLLTNYILINLFIIKFSNIFNKASNTLFNNLLNKSYISNLIVYKLTNDLFN